MSKPQKVPELESLAQNLAGVNRPELFFVSDQGVIVTVTRDHQVARDHYRKLVKQPPLRECALEARSHGVVASVEPESDAPGAKLVFFDAPERFPVTFRSPRSKR